MNSVLLLLLCLPASPRISLGSLQMLRQDILRPTSGIVLINNIFFPRWMLLGVSQYFAHLGHLHGNDILHLVLLRCRIFILKASRIFSLYQIRKTKSRSISISLSPPPPSPFLSPALWGWVKLKEKLLYRGEILAET